MTLLGSGFSPSTKYSYVSVQGVSVPISNATNNQVSIVFPSGVQEVNGKISIQYFANELSSNIFTNVSLK